MMSSNHKSLRLLIALVVLLITVPAVAQNVQDGQFFARSDLSPYGSGPRPRTGYFFTIDALQWAISTPDVTTVGDFGETRTVFYGPTDAESVIQSNTMDTSWLRDVFTSGSRIELGRIVEREGWFLSTHTLHRQSQRIESTNVDMVFFDPEFGDPGGPQRSLLEGIVGTIPDPDDPAQTINVIRDLPLTVDDILVRNSAEYWSVELMCLHRLRPFHRGGMLEVFAGVRFLEFDEVFDVDARIKPPDPAATPPAPGDPLGEIPFILTDSQWSTEAENHVVGPQFGARLFKSNGRWTLSAEGRFMAGFNSQNLRQRGILGSELTPPGALGEPLLMGPTTFTHSRHLQEFTPLIEVRAEAWFELTRAISVRAGWTAVWMDNVARSSNLINYQVPNMGLDTRFNRQDVFIHGLNLGIIVNR